MSDDKNKPFTVISVIDSAWDHRFLPAEIPRAANGNCHKPRTWLLPCSPGNGTPSTRKIHTERSALLNNRRLVSCSSGAFDGDGALYTGLGSGLAIA